jgi:hypothetical protein
MLFESFDIKDMLCYWQETDGSLLTGRFMTIVEQRHKVPKLSKMVFPVFVKINLRFLRENKWFTVYRLRFIGYWLLVIGY